MRFDLPAQPLQDALDRFNALTGWSGFYQAGHVEGRTAPALSGNLMPDAALRSILQGSGLSAHFTAPGTYVLEAQAPVAATELRPAAPRDPQFDGLLQARVREIFCGDARIAPADYRAALSFHVDDQGRVERPALLETTGDGVRDRAILQALNGVRVGRAPPAGSTTQPFVMLVVPRAMATSRDCEVRR